MEYKEYLKNQERGRRLLRAIREALKALDSRSIPKLQEWLIYQRRNHEQRYCNKMA